MNNSMECSCVCQLDFDFDDDGDCELRNEAYRIARKSYKCCECGAEISKGEKYEYVWGKWNGRQTVYRTCKTCLTIRTDFCCHGFYYGRLKGALWEALGINYITGEIREDEKG